ncbi:DTW domain-containing protein [Parashewanella curva]|uniref:tRNA-uridine aminocarboxypropyltransferase n=1 Tax=Parashewanella curva TaxID=2338552 RepID=A0A3L8PYU7_9GAMM|nr:DTW domain-containing protein [Parashewanella curva]RLV59262.1 DTW domain-containing protein [Parashewanella curva]
MTILKHRIHSLYDYRKSLSSTEFNARGKNISRCKLCLQARTWCLCPHRRQLNSEAAFAIVMYDDEVLKPSNTGRLIADLFPETYAFLWSRTEPNTELLNLFSDEQYQPILIFPEEYATEKTSVINSINREELSNKKPIFILLDGCWREAVKMFRKSRYLQNIPMLSFSPDFLANYMIRKGSRDFQLGTAEVASLALESFGETHNAIALQKWCDVFKESVLLGRNKRPAKDIKPFSEYLAQFNITHEKAILAGL